MSNISNDTANTPLETTTSETPGLVSLIDWATETDRDESHPSLTVLRLSTEPVYVSLFTDQGLEVAAHYLDKDETWADGYVYCLGHDCPACRHRLTENGSCCCQSLTLRTARSKYSGSPQKRALASS
jgi:hypothetical protein